MGPLIIHSQSPNPPPKQFTSNSQNGRTLQATIAGTNTDFSTPVQVTINGMTGIYTITETITFTDYGTLDFAHPYISVNYVSVMAKPINAAKPALTFDVREKYSITYSEFSGLVPVIRYSYHILGGYTLQSDGYGMVTDGYNVFSGLDIGNYLIIHSPPNVAGFYLITGLSADQTYHRYSYPLIASFHCHFLISPMVCIRYWMSTSTVVVCKMVSSLWKLSVLPSQAYYLSNGFYQFDYATYTSIKLDPLNGYAYFGSDFDGNNQSNAILDQASIYSIMLTDTRIGETVSSNQYSITKDFNSLKALKAVSAIL